MKEDRPDPLAIIAKLAQAEEKLATDHFLAPVLPNSCVRIRVEGIVYELTVDQRNFEGWAILRMPAPGKATVVERASPALVGKYLQILPRVKMVLLKQFGPRWFALAASTSDTRVSLPGPVPVHLVASAGSLDTANCRFDGANFWFENIDRRRDPAIARKLRESLNYNVKPDEMHCLGAVPQEKLAYRMLWFETNGDKSPSVPTDNERIAAALRHAGASLESFSYLNNNQSATVRFLLDGQQHSVVINPGDLSVISAGICLSGLDANFDLTSLVSVFREYSG